MTDTIQRADVVEITPEIIAQEALTVLATQLHLAKNVTKESELVGQAKAGQSVSKGATVSVPKTGTLVANQKSAGVAVTLQDPSMDKVDITVDQHWEVTIAPEDYAQAVTDRNIQDTYLGDMITALAEKIETSIAAQFANFTNSPIDATGATKDTMEGFVLQARKVITDNRAPMSGRFGYWETGAVNTLLQVDRFTKVSDYGANVAIQDGEVGTIHSFKTFESIFTPDDGGSPATYSNALMHRRAICLAMRPLPTPRGEGVKVSVITDPVSGLSMRALYSYNADLLADQLTLDVLFGVGVLRPELGVVIQTQ
jgi:hypothetical protein